MTLIARDATIAIVLDRQHAAEFELVGRNWLRWHPELPDHRWLFLLEDGVATPSITASLEDSRCLPWDRQGLPPQSSQREVALWQYLAVVPSLVETHSWIKIDTDVVAQPHQTGTAWLDLQIDGVVTGSGWGYTKPAGTIAALNAWARSALAPPIRPVAYRRQPDKDRSPRLIGWLGVYATDFSRSVATACRAVLPPVISHDTLLWYVAQATGQRWHAVPYEAFGWRHCRAKYLAAAVGQAAEMGANGHVPVARHSQVVIDAIQRINACQVAEVGVYRGTTSHAILATCPHVHLTMIDPWQEVEADSAYRRSGDFMARASQQEHAFNRHLAAARTKNFATRREVLPLPSTRAARRFAAHNTLFDLVFIDAAHDYDSVQQDIAAWWPLVRSGGLLTGHDYGHRRFRGVKQAVDAFLSTTGLEFACPVSHSVWQVAKP